MASYLQTMREKKYPTIKAFVDGEKLETTAGFTLFIYRYQHEDRFSTRNPPSYLGENLEKLPRLMIEMLMKVKHWPNMPSFMNPRDKYKQLLKEDLEEIIKETGIFNFLIKCFTIEELDVYGL